MVKKGKSSLRVENRHLIAKYVWKGVNKVLKISIFKTSLKGKPGDKKRPMVEKTYGMLLESAGNCTIKIGKSFPEHYLQQDFINKVRGKYDRIIQEEEKKIVKDEVKNKNIEQIKKEKNYVIKKLEKIEFKGKINVLNNWLDRRCPGKKFIEREGKNYRLLIYRVDGPKDKIKLFCSKYYQPAFRNLIKIETSVKDEIDSRFDKTYHIQLLDDIINNTCTEDLEKEHKEYDDGFKKFSWLPIIQNWDLQRSIIPEIKKDLRNGFSILILGESGSGKSNLIKRVAYDMHNEGWNVFEPLSEINIDNVFDQLIKSDKSLLVVDDAYNRINEIDELLIMNAKYRKKIRILCAERKERWFKKGKAPLGELELKGRYCLTKNLKLNEKEVRLFLKFKNTSISQKKIFDDAKYFMQNYSGKPGEFLNLLIFSGVGRQDDLIQIKYESIINSITMEEKSLLTKILGVVSLGGQFPKEIIKLNEDIDNTYNLLSSLTRKGFISITDELIETYHPFLCLSFVNIEHKDNPIIEEIIKEYLFKIVSTLKAHKKYYSFFYSMGLNLDHEEQLDLDLLALKFLDKAFRVKGLDKRKKALVLYSKAEVLKDMPNGVRYENKEYLNKALDCINSALELYPNFMKATINKGYFLIYLDRDEDALEIVNRLINDNNKNINALNLKAFIYYHREKFDKAFIYFDKVLKIDPEDSTALIYKASRLFLDKKLELAFDECNKILKINPDEYEALRLKGIILEYQNKPEEAIKCFERALKISPRSIHIWINRGDINIDLHKNYEKAIKCFNEGLKINPADYKCLLGKYTAFRKNNQYEPALSCLNTVLEINKDNSKVNVDALEAKSEIYFEQKNYNKALKSINKALDIDPENNALLFSKGATLEFFPNGRRWSDQKYLKKSEKIYKKLLDINERHEKAWVNLGTVLFHLEEYNESIECFDEANKIDDNIAMSWNGRALSYNALCNQEEALRSINKAIRIQPNYVVALINKGKILHDLHQYSKAIYWINKALKINPSSIEALYNKALSLEFLPDGKRLENIAFIKRAMKCYDKILKINPEFTSAWIRKSYCYHVLGKDTKFVEAMGMVSFLLYKEDSMENDRKILKSTEDLFLNVYNFVQEYGEFGICYECGIVNASMRYIHGNIYYNIALDCWNHKDMLCDSAKVVLDYLVKDKKSKIKNIKDVKDFTFKNLYDKITQIK